MKTLGAGFLLGHAYAARVRVGKTRTRTSDFQSLDFPFDQMRKQSGNRVEKPMVPSANVVSHEPSIDPDVVAGWSSAARARGPVFFRSKVIGVIAEAPGATGH